MFKKAIDEVIKDGLRTLEALKEVVESNAASAGREVDKCAGEMKALVALAKDVPEKIFDRYSSVMVATADIYNSGYPANYIALGGTQAQLRGIMGEEALKPGKYRVIVLLEPLS